MIGPDFEGFNQQAYRRIVRALKQLQRGRSTGGETNSQGILILGEAGTGKTHMLMRVARNLAGSNHILFVRKPNNEDAVAQHVWANIVESLTHKPPETGPQSRSQLDDLLAHVFTSVLIPEFEQDIRDGKDAEQKQRWADRLRNDPYHLFQMLGEGDRRQANMESIRRRTLRYLQNHLPGVDQLIAHVLITYCFVQSQERKRRLLAWLSGTDFDTDEAQELGVPESWVKIEDSFSEKSTTQQREEQALRAIRSIGILSTYYQPLILAFDQLEGLRDQEQMTKNWGDTVREIFTMTPNVLVVTCIFPSLWETWFQQKLDRSVIDRIAQQIIHLEQFGPQHGLQLLATHLEKTFIKHRLPTAIYPFTEDDIPRLCGQAPSVRRFIQAARSAFEDWLDDDRLAVSAAPYPSDPFHVVTQDEIDALLRSTMLAFESDKRATLDREIPIEQDFFGRIRNITETILRCADQPPVFGKASCGTKVMPLNFLLQNLHGDENLCIGVINCEGTAFAARMRNLVNEMRSGREVRSVVLLRDRRCKPIRGRAGQDYLVEFESLGGVFIDAPGEETRQ